MRAVRYAALRNTAKSRLVSVPEEWHTAGSHAHLSETTDGIVGLEAMARRVRTDVINRETMMARGKSKRFGGMPGPAGDRAICTIALQ